MTTKIPSLSKDGWTLTIPRQVDKQLSYYLFSEASQSEVYSVFSLPAQVAEVGNYPDQLKTRAHNDLTAMFDAYYKEGVTVTEWVVDKTPEGADKAQYDLYVQIIIVSDGETYSVAKVVTITDSQIKKITDYIATGEQS